MPPRSELPRRGCRAFHAGVVSPSLGCRGKAFFPLQNGRAVSSHALKARSPSTRRCWSVSSVSEREVNRFVYGWSLLPRFTPRQRKARGGVLGRTWSGRNSGVFFSGEKSTTLAVWLAGFAFSGSRKVDKVLVSGDSWLIAAAVPRTPRLGLYVKPPHELKKWKTTVTLLKLPFLGVIVSQGSVSLWLSMAQSREQRGSRSARRERGCFELGR